MKTLKDFSVVNKRVLLRAGFDVPLNEKGEIADTFRLEKTLPTLQYLLEEKAKVIILTHLDRPKGKDPKLSTKILVPKLEELLGKKVYFIEDCKGEKVEQEISGMQPGQIFLLENVRFYPEEVKGDSEFAQELASLGELYINEAFSDAHRDHASITKICQYLPSGIGFLFEREVRVLSRILTTPWRPLVALIAGVKAETKLKLINHFLKIADHVLVGGELANIILRAKGLVPAQPFFEKEILAELQNLELTNPKLHLPIDVVCSPNPTGQDYFRTCALGKVRREEFCLDIGPETLQMFSEILKSAKMIVWSGPVGYFESKFFEKGTRQIAEVIARNHRAFTVAGGGETLLALKKFGQREYFDFVSTGGGAMLEFLTGKKLPGIQALES